uniref:AlNc14C220G9098 protein n=1 Tax=Albugo laibachii Nc14 TaxID=890382 RepID=F0WRV6_9STRA|nr:AlNc14C220G9098 [Albugo laibachii Nc14]|eukprot:CCA24072.1 AlNc14C220G9098 [Albugo laibachii Nc14]
MCADGIAQWTDSIASSIKSFIGYKSNGKCAEGHFRFHFRSAQFDRKGNRSHRHLGNDVDITRDRTSVHVIVRYSSYPKTWLQSKISPNPIEYLFKLRIETPTIYLHIRLRKHSNRYALILQEKKNGHGCNVNVVTCGQTGSEDVHNTQSVEYEHGCNIFYSTGCTIFRPS